MARAVSVRLSDATRRRIARLARAARRSQSDVIRDAIEAFVERAEAHEHPYDTWRDAIGMVKDAPPNLSARTGEQVRRELARRRKTGRDRPMDFAQAALVRVAEREGIDTVFTVDRGDFEAYRIAGRRRFTILP